MKAVSETLDAIELELVNEFSLNEQTVKLLKETKLHLRVCNSLRVIRDALKRYRISELSIAFNGGKDNMLLLHLISVYLTSSRISAETGSIENFNAIYFMHKEEFTEVQQFVESISKSYKLNVITIFPNPLSNENYFKQGLNYLSQNYQNIKAIFLGTRVSDPYAENLTEFMMTDTGWPQYMRIFPILPWTYEEVWKYLLLFNVSYCSLYDKGYTSIGYKSNTVPNPSLSYYDNSGQLVYRPAYCLTDHLEERKGRISTEKS